MKSRLLNLTSSRAGIRVCLATTGLGLLFTFNTQGASVTYAGADLNTRGAWRTPSVAKPLDGDGNNIYGTDGYVMTTSPGGDLVQYPTYATVTRLATYTYYGGDQTTPHYLLLDNPSGGSMNAGLWMSTGTIDLQEQDMAEIAVTAGSSFRVGVLVDQCDFVDLSPKNLRLRQTQGGTADSGLIDSYLEPNLDGDWYFFDVRGAQAGDKFVLSATNLRAGGPFQDGNGIGGLTFDTAVSGSVLELQMYAGLKITGKVGAVYSVESIADLAQSNSASAWRCLEYLKLPASNYVWLDKSAPVSGRRFYRAVEMAPPTNMVFIPPGTFLMGSPRDEVGRDANEGPQTIVTISRGFWMGKYEVTQGEMLAVTGQNWSSHQGDPNLPAELIYWGITGVSYGATNYCVNRTAQERAAGRIGANCVYRLPTEAEWEYACRAGTTTSFSYGDDPACTNLANYAWYNANSGGTTHLVGQKLPNPWGLYDMYGNVAEWCQDACGYPLPGYPGGCLTDPQGAATGDNRPWRGGSFYYQGAWCRSSSRLCSSASSGSFVTGFRVVLAPAQP